MPLLTDSLQFTISCISETIYLCRRAIISPVHALFLGGSVRIVAFLFVVDAVHVFGSISVFCACCACRRLIACRAVVGSGVQWPCRACMPVRKGLLCLFIRAC